MDLSNEEFGFESDANKAAFEALKAEATSRRGQRFGFGRPSPDAAPSFLERTVAFSLTKVGSLVLPLIQRSLLAYDKERRSIERKLILDPNGGQVLKLGKYSFGLAVGIKIGTAAGVYQTGSPATTLRVKKIVINVPCPGFLYLSTLLTANVATTVGGVEDAWAYSAQSCVEVDYPTLSPSQKVTLSGNYTGLVLRPYRRGADYQITATLFGPSTIAGGC